MTPQLPLLPPHSHDADVSHRILELIGAEISEHRCDMRPDHLYVPEHDLVIRARGAEAGQAGTIEAYVWAEHEKWEKPAVAFMIGWAKSGDEATVAIAKDWASGVQPALCKLFHDPRNAPLRLTSSSDNASEGKVPWRGAVGGVHGWFAGPEKMELFEESYFLHAIMNDVCSLLHRRELLSVLCVAGAIDGKPEATVYCDGHIWPEASASLTRAPLPIKGKIPRALCQKMYLVLEPCRWEDVDRDEWPSRAMEDSGLKVSPAKPWWKRVLGR